jgi:hypothetical protein
MGLTLPMAEARGFTLQRRQLPRAEGLHRLHVRLIFPRAPRRESLNLRNEYLEQH